jgi:hypothetical protein
MSYRDSQERIRRQAEEQRRAFDALHAAMAGHRIDPERDMAVGRDLTRAADGAYVPVT